MDLSVQNDDKAVLCGFDCFVGEKGALIKKKQAFLSVLLLLLLLHKLRRIQEL